MGRFLLVVLPLGVALSWLLNVLRIAALVLIGARVSPEIAVNGFHSYAGWMFFTLLALGLMALVHAMPWLHRSGAATAPAQPLRDDPAAAMILPFAAFMAVGTATAALFDPVDIGYPLKALVLAAVLLIFAARYLSRLPWGADPVALLAGAVVGVGWVFTAPAPGEDAAALDSVLALVPLWFLLVWIGARVIGTTLLVPLAEELFFRGYVLARIDTGNGVRRVLAIAVSTLLFALLHGRLVAAGLAGLVFALVMLRRGRVTDAILAHVAANAIVAASALASGDWSRI